MENKNQNELPKVSITTLTTASRDKFIVSMVRNVLRQTYDHKCLEWLVVGDWNDESEKKFIQAFQHIPNVSCRYIKCFIDGDLGKKRNFACENARYKTIAVMDSDDYYNSSYISHSIDSLKRNKCNLVGCRSMLIYYPKIDGKMIMINGSSVHEATMVFTKKHWRQFKFASGMKAEGAQMVNGRYFNDVDILKIMICIAHDNNTFSFV